MSPADEIAELRKTIEAKDRLVAELDRARQTSWVESNMWFNKYMEAVEREAKLLLRLRKAGISHGDAT